MPGSVYDPAMGCLTDSSQKCPTCGMDSRRCPGHFGYIELNEPLLHPLYIKTTVALLKCICSQCHRIIFDPERIALQGFSKLQKEKRFAAILSRIDKIDICYYCKKPQPKVVYKIKENLIQFEYKQKSEEKGKKADKISITVTAADVKKIFDSVIDDDVRVLGFDPEFMRPKNLVMTIFPVLPTCARPYIVSDGKLCDDDLTTLIEEISKNNSRIGDMDTKEKPDLKKRQKYERSLLFHVETMINNSRNRARRPTDHQPVKGLKDRVTGKDGQLRSNHMGKRVDYSARTVIGPNPSSEAE